MAATVPSTAPFRSSSLSSLLMVATATLFFSSSPCPRFYCRKWRALSTPSQQTLLHAASHRPRRCRNPARSAVGTGDPPVISGARLCGHHRRRFKLEIIGYSSWIVRLGNDPGYPCGGTQVVDIANIRSLKYYVHMHGGYEVIKKAIENLGVHSKPWTEAQ